MAQQPPARSWFRLASIARLEAAEAAAAARATPTPSAQFLPRIPIPRIQQQPTSPPPPLQQQPAPPPPTPPPPPTMPQPEPQPDLPFTQTPQPENHTQTPNTPSFTEPQTPPTPPRSATPPESPKVIRPSNSSPPPSPMAEQTKTTLIQPPPIPEPEPPLLPLPQEEKTPEEKTITNSSGSRANHDSYKSPNGTPTNEDKKPRVITMAGDNIGAVMDIGSAAPARQHADGNGDRRKMEQGQADGKKGGKMAQKTKHMGAVVNSNVQGINNSIVLNSSTTQHSPGVHITLARNRKPKGKAISSCNQESIINSDHLH